MPGRVFWRWLGPSIAVVLGGVGLVLHSVDRPDVAGLMFALGMLGLLIIAENRYVEGP